jgi:transposase-like protein
MEQVVEWQSRPLDAVYPIIYLDWLVVKVRQDKKVINKTIYLALGVNMEGHKELLGRSHQAIGSSPELRVIIVVLKSHHSMNL